MSVPPAADMFGASGGDVGDVTVDMMDYQFINKSSNVKELEKVLRALRSGKNGYYPHLIQHCEERILKLNPKSRALRKEVPVIRTRDLSEDDKMDITNGLKNWTSEIKEAEKHSKHEDMKDGNLPPVRSAQVLKGKNQSSVNGEGKNENEERIRSWDYKKWDKYDPEKECEKVDKQVGAPVPANKKVTIPHSIDSSGMTEEDIITRSSKEKDKGNEAFKSGDFEEALAYYSRSISLLPSAASFNNRALVHLRLNQWRQAVDDCEQVMLREGENLKARLRRATAMKELDKLAEAKADLEFVLAKEPNNVRANKILEEVKSKLSKKPKKGRRMEIAEVQSDGEDAEVSDHPPVQDVQVDGSVLNKCENAVDKQKATCAGKLMKEVKSSEGGSFKPSQLKGNNKNTSKDNVQPDASGNQSTGTSNSDAKEMSSKCDVKVAVVQKPLPDNVEKIKQAANGLFRAGQYGSAAEKYTSAIGRLKKSEEYSHALALLHNNRAACRLKIGEDNGCIEDCAKVLGLKPFDVKALVRRASAYEHKEKYEKAFIDFKTAHIADLSASQAQDGANRVSKHLRDIYGPKWKDHLPEMPQVKTANTSHQVAAEVAVEAMKSGSKSTSGDGAGKTLTSDPPQEPGDTKTIRKDSSNNVGSASELPSKTFPLSGKQKHEIPEKSKSPTGSETKSSTGSGTKSPTGSGTKSPSGSGKKRKNKTKSSHKQNTTSSAAEPEDEKMKEKKNKIREDLYEKLKTEGNVLVRKKDFAGAVKCYTKCIQIDATQTAGYTNRSLCLLKLGKNVSAELDCTEALKLDPRNIKAYYRRAQARKNSKMFHQAEADLKKLLEIDPINKSASDELKSVQRIILDVKNVDKMMKKNEERSEEGRDAPPQKEADVKSPGKSWSAQAPQIPNAMPGPEKNKSKRKMIIEEVSDDENEEEHEKAVKPVPSVEKVQPLDVKECTSGPSAAPCELDESDTPQQDIVTPYEFGNSWNAVSPKHNIAAYKKILDRVPLDLLPSLVSNKTTDHMIVTLAKISRIHAETGKIGDVNHAYHMMSQLTKAQRFNMAAMFLNEKDKQGIRDVIGKFSAYASSGQASFTLADLDELKSNYML